MRSANFTLSLKRAPSLHRNHSRKFVEVSSKLVSPIFVSIKKLVEPGSSCRRTFHGEECVRAEGEHVWAAHFMPSTGCPAFLIGWPEVVVLPRAFGLNRTPA